MIFVPQASTIFFLLTISTFLWIRFFASLSDFASASTFLWICLFVGLSDFASASTFFMGSLFCQFE